MHTLNFISFLLPQKGLKPLDYSEAGNYKDCSKLIQAASLVSSHFTMYCNNSAVTAVLETFLYIAIYGMHWIN